MTDDKDLLEEAIARLKAEASSQEAPKAVVDETIRRISDARQSVPGPMPNDPEGREPRRLVISRILRLGLAAAALIVIGCVIGRVSGPAPLDMDELRDALTPSVAAAVEPAIRAKVVEELEQRYRLALTAAYVKVKEELTEERRDDLNRFAIQTLAASNAATNRLLAELVATIDTAQAEDLSRIAKVIYQIEQNRIQDKTQLAAGLQTLASRTEDELTRTRRDLVQLVVDVRPQGQGRPDRSTQRHPQ